jgi:hypothetical protein
MTSRGASRCWRLASTLAVGVMALLLGLSAGGADLAAASRAGWQQAHVLSVWSARVVADLRLANDIRAQLDLLAPAPAQAQAACTRQPLCPLSFLLPRR